MIQFEINILLTKFDDCSNNIFFQFIQSNTSYNNGRKIFRLGKKILCINRDAIGDVPPGGVEGVGMKVTNDDRFLYIY